MVLSGPMLAMGVRLVVVLLTLTVRSFPDPRDKSVLRLLTDILLSFRDVKSELASEMEDRSLEPTPTDESKLPSTISVMGEKGVPRPLPPGMWVKWLEQDGVEELRGRGNVSRSMLSVIPSDSSHDGGRAGVGAGQVDTKMTSS